jgi:hypothetical protein
MIQFIRRDRKHSNKSRTATLAFNPRDPEWRPALPMPAVADRTPRMRA